MPTSGEHASVPQQKEVSAGVIVFRRTSEGPAFLILYNGGDYWNFPKGKIQLEERSIEAAIRETCEETGISGKDMRVVKDFRTQERFTFRRDRKTIAIEISVTVAAINKNSGVICVPSAFPAIICFRAPGYIKVKISAKTMLNMMKVHSVESFAFMPSITVVFWLAIIFSTPFLIEIGSV